MKTTTATVRVSTQKKKQTNAIAVATLFATMGGGSL